MNFPLDMPDHFREKLSGAALGMCAIVDDGEVSETLEMISEALSDGRIGLAGELLEGLSGRYLDAFEAIYEGLKTGA